jgi:hypothetical protein
MGENKELLDIYIDNKHIKKIKNKIILLKEDGDLMKYRNGIKNMYDGEIN